VYSQRSRDRRRRVLIARSPYRSAASRIGSWRSRSRVSRDTTGCLALARDGRRAHRDGAHAGYAIFAIFGQLLDPPTTGSINTLNNGPSKRRAPTKAALFRSHATRLSRGLTEAASHSGHPCRVCRAALRPFRVSTGAPALCQRRPDRIQPWTLGKSFCCIKSFSGRATLASSRALPVSPPLLAERRPSRPAPAFAGSPSRRSPGHVAPAGRPGPVRAASAHLRCARRISVLPPALRTVAPTSRCPCGAMRDHRSCNGLRSGLR